MGVGHSPFKRDLWKRRARVRFPYEALRAGNRVKLKERLR